MYDKRNIILVAIAILVVALVAVGAYIIATGSNDTGIDLSNDTANDTTDVIMIDGTVTHNAGILNLNAPIPETTTLVNLSTLQEVVNFSNRTVEVLLSYQEQER